MSIENIESFIYDKSCHYVNLRKINWKLILRSENWSTLKSDNLKTWNEELRQMLSIIEENFSQVKWYKNNTRLEDSKIWNWI
jgi:hypothetical protein